MILVREIRQVEGGYIVEARYPYGGKPGGYGEVICKTFEEVVKLLRECSSEDWPKV